MRFLKMFLGVLFGMLFVLVIGIIVYVDGSLHIEARQLRKDMHRTYLLSRKPEHEGSCHTEGDILDISVGAIGSGVKAYQLRFLNDTDYVVEAVCFDRSVGPFKAFEGALGLGVKKIAGSGMKLPLNVGSSYEIDAKVLLKKNFRTLETGYEEGELTWSYKIADGWDDSGYDAALATCQGWGYQCCSDQTEVGEGEEITDTLDCTGYCYQSCKQKPYVVYFNSTPLMDRQNRLLYIAENKAEVGFGYEIADVDGIVDEAWVDYGDGQIEQIRPAGLIRHNYACSGRECRYEVSLSAVDNDDLGLTQTRLNSINILFRP